MKNADELDHLLNPPSTSPSAGLRDRLREETSRQVRRRRFTNWLRVAAAAAVCYAAGTATVWLTRPAPEVREVVVEVPAGTGLAAPTPAELPQSPRALELAAEQADGAESARLFLEAGRRYGRDWNDWPSAMRCYRNFLDLALDPPPIDPTNDDWLLVKLKTERRETHANP